MFLLFALIYFGMQFLVLLFAVAAEHRELTGGVIRLHVVADSDEAGAQDLKLKVRNAVTGLLSREMAGIHEKSEARQYIASHLVEICSAAQQVLQRERCPQDLTVTLEKEKFDRRDYDTFSLPAGRYDSLRITIGSGTGHNWWCVVFPALCVPASARDFENCASLAGMDPETVQTLEQNGKFYEFRFGLLDALGELGNRLFP